jgi:predicted RNase H-like HicB family nuclease
MKYIYPANFIEDDNGTLNVNFPDFESCFTYGSGLSDALDMAEDVLSLTLYDMEQNGVTPPMPSDIRHIHHTGGFLTLVRCDTGDYTKYFNQKPINAFN